MIRINLISGKKAKRHEAGQRQLLYMGMALLFAIGGVIFVHIHNSNHLDELTRQNSVLETDISRLKAELGDYDKIKAQREALLAQRKTIEALQSARTGPVFLLREFSEILTPGKGPTFDRITYEENLRRDPNAGFNSGWDTHRVWLESFEEDQRRIRVKGAAKSNEDVAEFLKRLNSSVFFTQVNPESSTQIASRDAQSVKHVSFSLTAGVLY